VQRAHPDATVSTWAFDEHRIGLKSILRRVWAPVGQRPDAVVAHRYQWMYVYGFVQPTTGATEWWLLPTVRADILSQVLAAFAQAVGARPTHQVVLVLDGAGWHKSQSLVVPDHLHLVFLPPYSPELQPAERLWPLSNEPLVNRTFRDLTELETVQAERCRTLQSLPALIRARTAFHWWPGVIS